MNSAQVPTMKGKAIAKPRSNPSMLPGVRPPSVAAFFSSSVASQEFILLWRLEAASSCSLSSLSAKLTILDLLEGRRRVVGSVKAAVRLSNTRMTNRDGRHKNGDILVEVGEV